MSGLPSKLSSNSESSNLNGGINSAGVLAGPNALPLRDPLSILNTQRIIVLLCLFVLLMRFATMGMYPLFDTTEARYAEIGRKMLVLNDWVTPWYADHLPFWAKPPLSMWTDAVSYSLFGVSEFTARLPHFLMGLLTLWIVYDWLARRSKQEAVYAVSMLAASLVFFVSSGAVMTDMSLALSCVIIMRGFWLGMHGNQQERKLERWLFFIGCGLGLLAKGPIALVLCGLPILAYTLSTSTLASFLSSFPWKRGILLMLAIAAPWYYLAEVHTPGFLNYFIVGEHWHRFVTPGWQGDKFGHAHQFPHGTIWAFTLIGLLPWTILIPLAAYRQKRQQKHTRVKSDTQDTYSWRRYLLLWALTPCLFFTMASNIIWTYELPAAAGFAMWAASWLNSHLDQKKIQQLLITGMLITVVGWLAVLTKMELRGLNEISTSKGLVMEYESRKKPGEDLVFYGERPYSAEFYSAGQAKRIESPVELSNTLSGLPVYMAMKDEQYNAMASELKNRLRWVSKHGNFDLLYAYPGKYAYPSRLGYSSKNHAMHS